MARVAGRVVSGSPEFRTKTEVGPNRARQGTMNHRISLKDGWRTHWLGFGLAAALLILPGKGWAGGTVSDPTEAALRAAMADGGLVSFDCEGTITVSSRLTNELDTVLDGMGHQVTISGGNNVGVFYVKSNVNFKLANLRWPWE